ncbi:UDP-glucuronosyltransferase 3A1 [Octodon degus]|uniref:UDP-glucuronosyltransferase n=1 Tax=Octodon degus TaxID=10160 RepID=A0A6P3EPX2_OCTDE|nr:UDP-glucuronosyltransferase 3A1 [Octodon degus]
MARQELLLLVCFFLPQILVSEGAKILTVSQLGASHYILMDKVSSILQDHGHQVTKLLNKEATIPDLKEEEKPYKVIDWVLPEKNRNEILKHIHSLVEVLDGRDVFDVILKLWEHMGTSCSYLLHRDDIMNSLRNESFDLVFLDATDLCAFLIAEKLEKPFVVLLSMFHYVDFGLPSPLSYVPVYGSFLTDQMDFWGRVRNFLMSFVFYVKQWQMHSTFDNVIKEHFPEGSRPVFSHLLQKAELWFINCDFGFDFARPLLPNTVYIGGLLEKPIKPIPQDLENFINKFNDTGFILVALGSFISRFQTQTVLKEMNKAFANLSQGVIWKCDHSLWPKDIKLAQNVKMVNWLPQNDLLAHPSIRLFVTHCGMNSIMETIQHGVPIVGIPVFFDQPDNMVRVEAKKFGVSLQYNMLTAETLILKIKEVIEDKRYKSAAVAASIIHWSQPLTPTQRLVGWIDHILQTGGAAHLKPYAFQQPWYEQYLLDVFLFLLGLILCTLWLCRRLLGIVTWWLSGSRKLKKT